MDHCRGRGGEGEVGDDHLVARADAQRHQRQMEGHRPVRHRERMLDAEKLGEGCLELAQISPLRGDPARLQAVEHIGALIPVQRGVGDGDRGVAGEARVIDHPPVGVEQRNQADAAGQAFDDLVTIGSGGKGQRVAVHHPGDRTLQRRAVEEAAADVTVGGDAFEAAFVVHDESDAELVPIEPDQRIADRGVDLDQKIFKHASLPRRRRLPQRRRRCSRRADAPPGDRLLSPPSHPGSS